MEFFKSLWPNTSTNIVTIPQHVEGEYEDDLDLKVRALAYLFKRLGIEDLPPFINDENGMFNLTGPIDCANEKLDAIYNKSEFERLLKSDEHRILVDWFKNRFRSLCILSGEPFSEFEHDLGRNFRFVVLASDSSEKVYIDTLANSDIYMEHSVDMKLKESILRDVLQRQLELRPSVRSSFNKNDRANIILQYVRKLSEAVQIERIYRASLMSKLKTLRASKLGDLKEVVEEPTVDHTDDNSENQGICLFPSSALRSSRSRSPVRRNSCESKPLVKPLSPVKLNPDLSWSSSSPLASPVKSIGSPNTTQTSMRSRSSSPIKSLKKKQSMTLLKMDRSLNDSSFSLEQDATSKIDTALLKSQAEQAVLVRVERELKLVRVL